MCIARALASNFLDGAEGIVSEVMGKDLNENVVLHRDDASTLYEIEVVGDASKVFDLSRLEVEGLPISATQGNPRESRMAS